jgi:hypothetical protein
MVDTDMECYGPKTEWTIDQYSITRILLAENLNNSIVLPINGYFSISFIKP